MAAHRLKRQTKQASASLMAAAMQGNVEILRALLERHAHADFTDLEGCSALHYAIAAGKLEAVQVLLPLVSNIEAPSSSGNDLLTLALETGDMNIFQAVLEQSPATLQWTTNTRRALDSALRADMKDQVRLLLSKHPRLPPAKAAPSRSSPMPSPAMTRSSSTPCWIAAATRTRSSRRRAEKEFMSLVKSKYLRLYIQEETGINVLMLAAGLGKTDYVRALLDAGADRNRTTPREKCCALYFAAWTENWQCVQMLLGGGPMPDQLRRDFTRETKHVGHQGWRHGFYHPLFDWPRGFHHAARSIRDYR